MLTSSFQNLKSLRSIPVNFTGIPLQATWGPSTDNDGFRERLYQSYWLKQYSYYTTMKLLINRIFIMVTELRGVQFGLKSYAWFQNRMSAQRKFDLKSQEYDFRPKLHFTHFNYHLIIKSILKLHNFMALNFRFMFCWTDSAWYGSWADAEVKMPKYSSKWTLDVGNFLWRRSSALRSSLSS